MKFFRFLLLVILIAVVAFIIFTVFFPSPQPAADNVSRTSVLKGVDTIIDEGVYQSYFSYTYKEPLFVKYVLYHGGGPCSRAHFRFHNDTEISMATTQDYSHSGYDEGHLANADDFAYDCDADEKTFRFYNCVPQTPHLNRGAWKHWESEIRKESQDDSLLIITGSIFGSQVIGDGVYVPDYCWKVAESLSSKIIINVIICDNTPLAQCDEISLDVLQGKLGYTLPLAK
jgi:endonuclease G, mitochondrial